LEFVANISDAKQKRILLIGVGRWGANHLRILTSMPIEVFVADHHEQRLKSAGVPETHRKMEGFRVVEVPVSMNPRFSAPVITMCGIACLNRSAIYWEFAG
jgi:hypothetical protein